MASFEDFLNQELGAVFVDPASDVAGEFALLDVLTTIEDDDHQTGSGNPVMLRLGSMEQVGTYASEEDKLRLRRVELGPCLYADSPIYDGSLTVSSGSLSGLKVALSSAGLPEASTRISDSQNLLISAQGVETARLDEENLLIHNVVQKRWKLRKSKVHHKLWVVNQIWFASKVSVTTLCHDPRYRCHVVPSSESAHCQSVKTTPSQHGNLITCNIPARNYNWEHPEKVMFAFRAVGFVFNGAGDCVDVSHGVGQDRPVIRPLGDHHAEGAAAPLWRSTTTVIAARPDRVSSRRASTTASQYSTNCPPDVIDPNGSISNYATGWPRFELDFGLQHGPLLTRSDILKEHPLLVTVEPYNCCEEQQPPAHEYDCSGDQQPPAFEFERWLQVDRVLHGKRRELEDEETELCTSSLMTEIGGVLMGKDQIYECSSSSPHNLSSDDASETKNLLFINTLEEELMQIDNICEVSSNHGDLLSLLRAETGRIIFVCYDTKGNQFEFYFKDSQDMASVVGVGLQYARVVLDEGWKIKVEEVSKLEWEQTLSVVRSSATSVFKSLKLELPRSGGIEGDTEFTGRPLLWDLAKYFILKEIVASYANGGTNGASSSNQPSFSGKNTQGNGGDSGTSLSDYFTKGLAKMFFDNRDDRRDDDEDGENHDPNGEPPDPSHRALDKNCDTVVAIHLLEGGQIVNSTKAGQVVVREDFDAETMEKLKVLDETILPNLEFKFSNQNGTKTIRSTIGKICFNLDEEERWLHDDMRIFFGLHGRNQDFGEVERHSFKQLDLDPRSSTEITRLTRTLANRQGNAVATSWEATAKPVGFGGSLKSDTTTSGDDTDSRQFEAGCDRPCDYTRGGLTPKKFAFRHKIGCHYYALDYRNYLDLHPLSPFRCSQDVEFQGLWNIIEAHPNASYFAEYELMASRSFEEFVLDESMRSDGGSKATKFKQEYKKKILLNHRMTHLDGQRRNLRELARQFGALGETFLVEKGRRDEYIWRNKLGSVIDSLATLPRSTSARHTGA